MRIFTASLATETNTFSPVPTDMNAFKAAFYAGPGEHPDTPTLCSSVVPILRRPHGHTVLLTRRADHLRQHKGQISFPGGRRDQTDSSYAFAALREAQEEVGLPPEAVQVLGYLDDHPTLTGYRITPVVGYIDSPFSPVTDPGEVAEAFELPLGHVADDDCFQRKVLSRGGFDVPFLEIQYAGHQIWGATAAILWNLREQLRAG